ncbi:MAG: hypothetical protein U9O89_08080 [Thermoproteota archaeon]|nr:hypothetical protein [Thermoproteota archaeon]
MEQAIRALSWAIRLFWIMLIIFSVTVAYSLFMLLGNVEMREPQFFASNGDATVSLPFFINNTSYYDMSDLNITTYVVYEEGATLCNSTTYEELIPKGSVLYGAHNVSINLNQTITNYSNLLFNDTYLNMHAFVSLKFAKVIPLQIAFNQTLEWGAPFYNFTLHQIFYNETTANATVLFGFENHFFMDLNGTIQIRFYDDAGNPIGSGETDMQVPSHSPCQQLIELSVTAKPETAHFYFQTDMFSFGPLRIHYG